MSQIWILDTNILSYWIVEKRILHDKFKEIYSKRYKDSLDLINKLINRKKEKVFVIEFSINEAISTIRDEIRAILMFSKGIPLSRWPEEKWNTRIDEELGQEIYETFLNEIDNIFENSETNFSLLNTIEISDEKTYLEVYSSLIFLIPRIKTQDAVLLTTTIFNKADYFVTRDKRLIKDCKESNIKDKYNFEVIHTGTAIRNLNSGKLN